MSESADTEVQEAGRKGKLLAKCMAEVMRANPQLDERDAAAICERRMRSEQEE